MDKIQSDKSIIVLYLDLIAILVQLQNEIGDVSRMSLSRIKFAFSLYKMYVEIIP
jgi:hypothetical protein